jgi:hypothetical protein
VLVAVGVPGVVLGNYYVRGRGGGVVCLELGGNCGGEAGGGVGVSGTALGAGGGFFGFRGIMLLVDVAEGARVLRGHRR